MEKWEGGLKGLCSDGTTLQYHHPNSAGAGC
ncbi:hypothetical protein B0G81_7679 [Paraburkholderia sp. BL6665CI2N2]|nr:hypothetical protein B0G81_7679 [Paraburkholderia sp. BL6665CI2N2]